ncbi:efflux RND transporter permease subunit, partial [Brachyspira hyodysenteriae]|uniref:efflux RND transporter permease subunit n=1 Tax=Brachyspira hyodysenteriae TaxID=159 RepID=UPI001F52C56D
LMYSKESSDSIGQASMYDTKTIYKEFNKPFIPYVKVTLDFILPLNLTAGIYVAYDIPFMESKTHDFKLSSGEGNEMYQPLSLAVLGGLTVSTMFTLVIVPTVYAAIRNRIPLKDYDAKDLASVETGTGID